MLATAPVAFDYLTLALILVIGVVGLWRLRKGRRPRKYGRHRKDQRSRRHDKDRRK